MRTTHMKLFSLSLAKKTKVAEKVSPMGRLQSQATNNLYLLVL